MSTTKPTMVLVPGAWHSSKTFDKLTPLLSSLGYQSTSIQHPSVGADPPTENLTSDVTNLRSTLTSLADEGKEMIVLLHSYAGLVGSCAVEGMDVETRRKEGKSGGVVAVVFMSAFVVPKGKTAKEMMPGGEWLWFVKMEGDKCYPNDPADLFYHDLPSPAEQEAAIADLKHHCTGCFVEPATYEPWHDIPCFYLFCTEDHAMPLVYQEAVAASMGEGLKGTYRVEASHSPMLSRPQEVVGVLEEVWGAVKGSG